MAIPNFLRSLKNLITESRFLHRALLALAQTSLYRAVLFLFVRRSIKYMQSHRIFNIEIETSSVCNARCVFCLYNKMTRDKTVMSDETFSRIVDRLLESGIRPTALLLNGFGEPLIDRKLPERIARLRSLFPATPIKFHSNFSLADDAWITDLLKSGLSEINISFNGIDQQSYEENMRLDYHKTLGNIKKLVQSRNASKSRLIIRISIAVTRFNERDFGIYRKFRNELGVDSVVVNKALDMIGADISPKGRYTLNLGRRPLPCKALWGSIVIDVKGNIVLCCIDYDSKHIFGNVFERPLMDIYYCRELEDIRKNHLSGRISPAVCAACPSVYGHGLEWLFKVSTY